MPCPVLYDGKLYFLKSNSAVLSCFDAASGKAFYEAEKLNGLKGVFASPVAAAGRVYVLGRNGVTAVVRHGKKLEILATNRLDDSFTASPAVPQGQEVSLLHHGATVTATLPAGPRTPKWLC